MFCSLARKPLILRLYGTARAIHEGEAGWSELIELFPPMRGARNLFDVHVDLAQTSCGYGVPLFDFQGQRTLMDSWAENKGEAGLNAYREQKNRFSIDGYPTGLPDCSRLCVGRADGRQSFFKSWASITRMPLGPRRYVSL